MSIATSGAKAVAGVSGCHPCQGGGGLRPRWRDTKGRIYEWDKRHGTVEIYDRTGKRHRGEHDPVSGRRLGPADPQRRIEP